MYFLLIQFFLQFDSEVYRTKSPVSVFQVLLPWQHQLLHKSTGSPVKHGCGSEFTVFQIQEPISTTTEVNGKCMGPIGWKKLLNLCLSFVSLILVSQKSAGKLLLSSEGPSFPSLWFFWWADWQHRSNLSALANSSPRKSRLSALRVLRSRPKTGSLFAISFDEAQTQL